MSEDPREALLSVARDIIDKRGYVGLTMRTASAAAGVTPDVARRYYRNRDALFAAALRLPDDPVSAIPALLAPGIEGMGERLVRFSLDTLRDPQARDDLMSLARAGVSAGQAVTGLQEFIEIGVVDRIAGTIGVPDARMRASLITSYLMGVAIMRYGVRLEPLASASEEEVIRMVAPVIQDLLDPRRPIPGSARDRAKSAAVPDSSQEPGIRRRTFDPDPAATRAAKLRSEQMEAARASAAAKRAEARAATTSAPKAPAPGARPAAKGSGGTSATPVSKKAPSAPAKGATPQRAGTKQAGTEQAGTATPPAKKTPAQRTPAKKAPAKTASAKAAPAKKSPAKKAPAKKAPATNGPDTPAPESTDTSGPTTPS